MLGFHGLLGPISGGLVNRFGTRVVCVTGSLMSSLGFFFAALVQNVPCLMLTYGNYQILRGHDPHINHIFP